MDKESRRAAIRKKYLNNAVDDLQIGDEVLLADGTVNLLVAEKQADYVSCRVIEPGIIRSRQGIQSGQCWGSSGGFLVVLF